MITGENRVGEGFYPPEITMTIVGEGLDPPAKEETRSMSKEMTTKSTFTTRDLAIIPIFAAITAVLAQIAIPIPFTAVPISFGLVAVYMSGILLTPKQAVYSQICYLLLGAVGLPVFGGFKGGLAALVGPTGGYLMVYPLCAWIVAMALNSKNARQTEKNQSQGMVMLRAGIAMLIAHTILYLGGTIWLSFMTKNTFIASLSLAVIPFIPLDIIKILFCTLVIVPFRKRLIKAGVILKD